MKPNDCKTSIQARVAALAIYEARMVNVTGLVTGKLDDALFNLEHEYWRRAAALAKAKKPKRKKPRHAKR